MIRIARNTTKRVFTGEIPPGAGDYYLLDFYCAGTGLHVYCVCADVNASAARPVELVIIETGNTSPVPLSGQVRLLPIGEWKLTVYQQASSTNLDPEDADALLYNDVVNVSGEDAGTEYTGQLPGGACPMTVTVTVDGVLEETLLNVDPCVANTVNIAITYS